MNKEIARELGATERTIKAHRSNIMEKLQIATIAELVLIAERVASSRAPDRERAMMANHQVLPLLFRRRSRNLETRIAWCRVCAQTVPFGPPDRSTRNGVRKGCKIIRCLKMSGDCLRRSSKGILIRHDGRQEASLSRNPLRGLHQLSPVSAVPNGAPLSTPRAKARCLKQHRQPT